MPENITKPPALRALTDFNGIDIHGPLESVIKVMPKFDSNTLLAEIQNFSTTLSNSITKIKAIKEEEIGKNIWYKHNFLWFRAHLRAAYIYLDKVSITLVHMKEAIGSTIPDKIAAEASAILALKGDAAQLDHETQELMRKYNISEDELKKSMKIELKTAMETVAQLKTESSLPTIQNIPDELDLHGKTVEEAIPLIDKYLEDNYSANKHRVWIVHGKGTGVLKQAVGEHLTNHKLVKSSTLADNNRGGEGATQVDLID